MRRLFWDLRWALPWNRNIRENGATLGYTPRPPMLDTRGETPGQFKDRLAWALTDHAGFLKRERLPLMAAVFEARYPSRCGVCDNEILPGDPVTYEDDELVHEDCADD